MADTLVETAVSVLLDVKVGLHGPYWENESVGILVFIDAANDLSFARTADKGANWATTEISVGNVSQLSCWYDKETPGNTGTLIHMAWLDADDDICYYRTLDVSDGSLGTERTVASGLTVSVASQEQRVAVTQTVDGTIIVAFSTQAEIACYNSADGMATPASIDDVFETGTEEDWCLLFPAATADDADACALFWDRSADEISLKVYDDSTDTWTEKSISGSMIDDFAHMNMDASVRHSDSKILGSAHTNDDDAGDDLITFELTVDDPDAANCTVTAKTNVFTNQGESAQVAVWINQIIDQVRIAYLKGGTWTDSVDVVCHISNDGMATWEGEQAYSQDGPDDFRLVHAGRTVGAAGGRYQPAFFNDDTTDIWVNVVNDTEIVAGASISVAHAFPHGGESELYTGAGPGLDPTSGSYWAANIPFAFTGILLDATTWDVAVPTARSWWCWEFAVATAAAPDQNQEFYIFGTDEWNVRGQFEDANPPTYYTVRLYNIVEGLMGEGSTQFALGIGTFRPFRFTWLSGQVALEVDGTYEVNASTARDIPLYVNDFKFGGGVGGIGTTAILLRKVLLIRGDSSSDRPDETTQTYTAVEPDPAGTPSYTAWTGADNDFDDWNSGGANDGDTTYITPGGTSVVKESAVPLAVPSITAGRQHAYWQHHRVRMTGSPSGSKNLGDALIHDGTNDAIGGLGSDDGVGWLTRSRMYKKAPDGNDWDQMGASPPDLSLLEIGSSGKDLSGSLKPRHTATWGEFVEWQLDPGDPPGIPISGRRHVSVTHG